MVHRTLGVTLLSILLLANSSQAQTDYSVALDKFDPAPPGDTFFGVPSSQTNGHLVARGRVVFALAQHSAMVDRDGDGPILPEALLATQGLLHFGASLALWNRMLVSASFPVAVLQQGNDPRSGNILYPSPANAQPGDLRFGARISMVGTSNDIFQLSTGASFYLPTAPTNSYTGDGSIRVAPELLMSGKTARIRWSILARPIFHRSGNPSTISYGGAIGYSLVDDRLRVGLELLASTPLAPGAIDADKDPNNERESPIGRKTNAEAWLGIQGRIFGSLWLGVAGGPGLDAALGTPRFRVLGMLSWSPEGDKPRAVTTPKRDTDGDGWTDDVDPCPYAFGEKNPPTPTSRPGCPWIDTDEDGIADTEDACPEEPTGAVGDPERQGCPSDRDRDGVRDVIDFCPDTKGEVRYDGCPSESITQ